jgi:hypothetical protein
VRRRWDHESPEGHQPRPRDNTTRYVYAQVSRWLRTDEPIHPEVAMEIAAWYHSPARRDTAITAFADHGAVSVHGVDGWDDGAGFGPDLGDTIRRIIFREDHGAIDRQCLSALLSYVADVERHVTRYRRDIWHGGGHRWMSTNTVDEDSCLTCGVLAILRPEADSDGGYGCYYGGDGELIISCTGRTDLVHGCERHCGHDTCQEFPADGTCEHTEHECNCLLCHN